MNVQKVWGVDICRDGGSYSLCFNADEGRWYELLLQVQFHLDRPPTHRPPVIYLEGVNVGKAVRTLTWHEAKQFISTLRHDSARFTELVSIIAAEGAAAR
jgi:hypothetical protein